LEVSRKKTSKIKLLTVNRNLIRIFAYLFMNVSVINNPLNCVIHLKLIRSKAIPLQAWGALRAPGG
jgi:hypothetical protein